MNKQKGYCEEREVFIKDDLKAIIEESQNGIKLVDVMYRDDGWHRWSEEMENPISFRTDFDSAEEVREAILEEIN